MRKENWPLYVSHQWHGCYVLTKNSTCMEYEKTKCLKRSKVDPILFQVSNPVATKTEGSLLRLLLYFFKLTRPPSLSKEAWEETDTFSKVLSPQTSLVSFHSNDKY